MLISSLVLIVAACASDSEATSSAAPASSPTPTLTATATEAPDPTVEPTLVAIAKTGALAPTTFGEPQPAPELAGLVNADGSTFDLARFQGTNTLLFFGYTHCPDVCPTTIGEIFGVFQDQPDTQAVFVSVDPERDTPEFLDEWTQYFPENFNAVTGSPGAIRRAADNYGVKYARVETTSTSGYTMSHTADLYLIDEDGQLLLTYPFGTPAAEIAEDLSTLNTG